MFNGNRGLFNKLKLFLRQELRCGAKIRRHSSSVAVFCHLALIQLFLTVGQMSSAFAEPVPEFCQLSSIDFNKLDMTYLEGQDWEDQDGWHLIGFPQEFESNRDLSITIGFDPMGDSCGIILGTKGKMSLETGRYFEELLKKKFEAGYSSFYEVEYDEIDQVLVTVSFFSAESHEEVTEMVEVFKRDKLQLALEVEAHQNQSE